MFSNAHGPKITSTLYLFPQIALVSQRILFVRLVSATMKKSATNKNRKLDYFRGQSLLVSTTGDLSLRIDKSETRSFVLSHLRFVAGTSL